MANYGLKYQCTFDPPSGGSAFFKPRYRLEILQKEYSGGAVNILGAYGPVNHSWITDEPKAPIKGSSLAMNFINKGNIPLRNFYSANDDEYKVRFYWLEVGLLVHTVDRLLFEGFLVQADHSELMVDYSHVITLAANDNLGLLKNIALDKAPASFQILWSSFENYEITYSGPEAILLTSIPFGQGLNVGQKISIDNGPLWTIKYLVQGGNVMNVGLVETPTTVSQTTGNIQVWGNTLIGKVTINSILRTCLSATGLQLDTYIYNNLLEENQVNTDSCFAQTLIDVESFMKGETEFKDCYTILQEILTTFKCTLFQAEGRWQIVRWDELRYYSNNIPGFRYDKDFNLLGTTALPDALIFDKSDAVSPPDTYPVHGLTSRILSPYSFVKETFNYKQVSNLLKNWNLRKVGPLIRSLVTGTGTNKKTINEYGLIDWFYNQPWAPGDPIPELFIRVVLDHLNNELERYLVVKGPTGNNFVQNLLSSRIEATKGDNLNVSFAFRLNRQHGPNRVATFMVRLWNSQMEYFAGNTLQAIDEGWSQSSPGWQVPYSDSLVWNNVDVTPSKGFPISGFVTLQLGQYEFDNVGSSETHYKDFRVTYTPYINDSTKIIGQTHLNNQVGEIRFNDDSEIYVDDSPRNSINGTLFLDSTTDGVQDRTTKWQTANGLKRLGEQITFEELFHRRTARTILDGSFIGLLHANKHSHVSLLNTFRWPYLAGVNFVFGKLTINYSQDQMNNISFYEMYKDGEVDTDLTNTYKFDYIFDIE